MFLGLSTNIKSVFPTDVVIPDPVPSSPALALLGARNGFAIDFVAKRMRINDSVNTANNFDGNPEAKLTNWGSDDYSYDPVRGLEISALRDFSVALNTSYFPYNTSACTVYITYSLNSELSDEQRYLVMADNAGADRLALYAVANQSFRFVSGDGVNADIALTTQVHNAGQEYKAVIGVDANGKTYVDEAGIHIDSTDVLNASTPSHLGIGGYPDRVLRVLDGYIRDIVVVCEPVEKAERLTLAPNLPEPAQPPASLGVFDILAGRNGFAIDFVARQMKINDNMNAANAFEGDPEAKLVNFGADPFEYDPVKGLNISAGRDFSIGLATSDIPFNPSACTVYAKYRLNTAISPEQRYLFMTDNAGDDRFALYSVSGEPFRFVSGDGAGPDIVVSTLDFSADTEYRVVFGADPNGKSFIDAAGIHADHAVTLASSAPSHIGIGGYNDRVLRVLDGYLAEIVVVYEPMPREARLTLDPFFTIYKAEGDSHTYNTNEATWGVAADQFYAARVAQAMGPRFLSSNYGWSGDSSAEMVFQLPQLFIDESPDIATIYAGANDGKINIVNDTVPTTTQISVLDAYKTRLELGGFVEVNGEKSRVVARSGNLITLDPPLSVAPLVGDQIAPDTQANIEHWIDEVRARGVQKIAVLGYHFVNFAVGGDTPTQEHPSRSGVRDKQRAAAQSRNVPYIDLYAHMAAKITSGEVAQGDDLAWHVDVGNTHLNVAGEQAIADAVYDAFVSLGWN